MLKQPAIGAWIGAALLALAAAPAIADVGGLITDAATGAPLPAGAFAAVQLTRCTHAGNQLCDQPADFTFAENGRYRFKGAYEPGRYQVSVTADGYLGANETPFEMAGGADHRVDVALTTMPLKHGRLATCAQPDARGYCRLSFEIMNTGPTPLDLQTWTMVSSTSPVPAGWSRFSFGDRTPAAQRLQLAAGERRTVAQQVYLGRDMPTGSIALMDLYVSPWGEPAKTMVYDFYPAVTIGQPGGAARTEEARLQQQRHARALPASAADRGAQPAGRNNTILVEVTDAQTGEPLPLSAAPKFRLMACNLPTDDYCRWIEGDEMSLTESGVVVVDTANLWPGRYQMQTRAGDNYAYTYSATFEAPTSAPMRIEMPMQRMPVAVDGARMCENEPLAGCVLEYRLRNTTAEPQQAALWAYNNMLGGEFSVGTSVYAQGRGGKALGGPILVRLAPGESKTVRQPAGMEELASGSNGWLQLYVSDVRDPAYGKGFYRLGNYTIYQDGGPKMINFVPFPFAADQPLR